MTRYDLERADYRVSEYTEPLPNPAPTRTKKKKKKKSKSKVVPALAIALGIMVAINAVTLGIAYSSVKNASTSAAAASASASENSDLFTSLSQTLSTDEEKYVLTDVSDIVSEAMPSVVSITSRALVSNGGFSDFFAGMFGGTKSSSTEEVDSGIGSGTIIGRNDSELLILTSYHVVEDCSSLYVTFNDNNSVDGYIKAAATDHDIAVVAVPLEDISEDTLSAISIAKLCTDDVEVGDGVIVIGDALGYGQSVVTGIISATNREITVEDTTITVLQTDAAINSGNSGGCMLNSKGEIIGISEAKITVTSVEGMCYAIPIKENYDLIQKLMTGEYNDLDTSVSVANADYMEGNEDDYDDYGIFNSNGHGSIF